MPKIERNVYQIVGHFSDVKEGRSKYHQEHVADRLGRREPICVHNCENTAVYLRGEDYRAIFGAKRADSENKDKSPIVKISRNGRSILRIYHICKECTDIKNFVGLTYDSLLKLCAGDEDLQYMNKLNLSPGNRLWFYLRYSELGVRIGIWAGIFSILSIIFSIVGMIL